MWDVVARINNELFCALNLKYLFCEFILNELRGFSWYPIVSENLRNETNPNTFFGICVKFIEELKFLNTKSKYCKPTKQTFQVFEDLLEQMEVLTKDDNVRMVIEKIKKLLMHLEYNLVDVCHMAVNEHQQKYDIEEKVKLEINNPVFKMKN